jgi:hypothetical protein
MHFRFEHEFDTDPKSYWDLFFSSDYTEDLYRQLRMKSHKILEQKEEGNVLRRTVHMQPAQEVPAVFKSVIKDTSYTEYDLFHRDRSAMDVTIEPGLMKDKFETRGVYSVLPAGEGRCRRVFEGDVKVSIMLVGGKIEKYIVDEMRASYEVATRVTREWIQKRKAAV